MFAIARRQARYTKSELHHYWIEKLWRESFMFETRTKSCWKMKILFWVYHDFVSIFIFASADCSACLLAFIKETRREEQKLIHSAVGCFSLWRCASWMHNLGKVLNSKRFRVRWADEWVDGNLSHVSWKMRRIMPWELLNKTSCFYCFSFLIAAGFM